MDGTDHGGDELGRKPHGFRYEPIRLQEQTEGTEGRTKASRLPLRWIESIGDLLGRKPHGFRYAIRGLSGSCDSGS